MKIKTINRKNFFLILIFFSCITPNYGQEKKNNIYTIIDSLKLGENYKFMLVDSKLKPLKYEAEGEDSVKLLQLEKLLNDKEIYDRIAQGFMDMYTENEIDELFNFINSSAFTKLNSPALSNYIQNKFEDILTELDRIYTNIHSDEDQYKPDAGFIPIPVDREDGFYVTIDYDPNKRNEDIILEAKPSITKDDILEIKKGTNNYPEIDITFTEKGAGIFYRLTKNNLSKPIPIVINNHIIAMPIARIPISGGKISISGNFSDEEIERMIDKIKK